MIVRAITLSVPVIVPDEYEDLVYVECKELPQWVQEKAIELGEAYIPEIFIGYRVSSIKDVEFECVEPHHNGMTVFYNMRIELR